MKIPHAKVLIMFLFYIDATIPETIKITRYLPEDWKDGDIDSFQIPQSVCHQESSGYGNYCNTLCTTDETENGDRYSCSCPEENATVTYLNNKWKCLGNLEVRRQLANRKQTGVKANRKQTGVKANRKQTGVKANRKQTEVKANRKQTGVKANGSS
ncbi:hypothetical protein ACROYT_G032957 [Oculina patagonica]